MITAHELELPGIAHGFFTREGGHSQGLFASLNCGLRSGDDVEKVKLNRARVATALGVNASHLVSPYQTHGSEVAVVTEPLTERPKVDGIVSKTRGVALGILTADCAPILFADAKAGVIGACHAGWKGALGGVYRSTVEAMQTLDAKRENIVAVLGPMISQQAYEVGPDFVRAFLANNSDHAKYFIPSVKERHYMFDLPLFLTDRMSELGLGKVIDLGLCTYADEKRFFSYRRATHRGEAGYGRLISALILT